MSARRRRSSKGSRRDGPARCRPCVSRRISRPSAVSRTSCTWECLSVAQALDRWHYMSIFSLRQCTSRAIPDSYRKRNPPGAGRCSHAQHAATTFLQELQDADKVRPDLCIDAGIVHAQLWKDTSDAPSGSQRRAGSETSRFLHRWRSYAREPPGTGGFQVLRSTWPAEEDQVLLRN